VAWGHRCLLHGLSVRFGGRLPLLSEQVALVGGPVALVSGPVALVCDSVALVCGPVALIRHLFTLVGDPVPLVSFMSQPGKPLGRSYPVFDGCFPA
jgi:hypothetical protein